MANMDDRERASQTSAHEKSSASNREIVLFHSKNPSGKHPQINPDLVPQVSML